jgi:hypothetical protein
VPIEGSIKSKVPWASSTTLSQVFARMRNFRFARISSARLIRCSARSFPPLAAAYLYNHLPNIYFTGMSFLLWIACGVCFVARLRLSFLDRSYHKTGFFEVACMASGTANNGHASFDSPTMISATTKDDLLDLIELTAPVAARDV